MWSIRNLQIRISTKELKNSSFRTKAKEKGHEVIKEEEVLVFEQSLKRKNLSKN